MQAEGLIFEVSVVEQPRDKHPFENELAMTPTLTKQLDLSPADIRLRARNIVVIGIIVGCSLIGLDHSLTAYFVPEKTIEVLPVLGSLSGLLLMIAVSTALMRTLGGLTDESLLERVKQVNSALAESEERYRGLFETSPDAMIYRRLGADGTMQLIDVNDAYLSLFGYKRSDITPDIASGQRLTPESRKRWHDEYLPVLERDGFVDNMVLDGLRTDGTSFPATARVFGIRDDAGKIVANWTTLRDMSAQENAEHELQESETKFRRLFETCQLGLIAWNIDADGKPQLDALNDSVLAMYDMDMETAWDTISKMEHITRESSERWDRDHLPTLKKVGFGKDQKLVGIRSNGSHFPILIDTWYVKDEYGKATGLWGALRDVTESEKIEQDLRLKNRALEQSSVAISILDRSRPDHYMYYTNPAYEKMTGYSTQDFDGQQPVRFAKETEEDRATLAKIVADMDQGRPTQARVWVYKKDGSRHLRDIQNSPVRDDDGTITHWISVGRDITQEVEDETQLKLFKRAVEQASNSIAIIEQTDHGPRGSYLNPAFEQMTGYNLESLRAHHEAFLAVPSGKPDLRKQFDVGFETGVRVHGRLWATNRDGTAQLRDVVNSPVRDEKGIITHWISVSRDVTQEVEDEQALRLFKRAMEQNPAAITIVEEQDGAIPRVAFVNDSIERMHGFSKGAIIGKPANLFVTEGRISPELADSMKEARTRGEALDTSGYFKRPDGSDGWLSLRYAPVRDASNTITHWISYGADITEQHTAENTVRRNAAILEQLTDTVILSGLDGVIIDCNQVSEKTLGRSREALIGHKLSSFTPNPEEQNKSARIRSEEALTSGGHTNEVPLIHENGETVILECSTKLLLNDGGEPEGWITVGRDITEKRAAEEELRVLKRAMEQSPTAIIIVKTEQTERPRIAFANPALKNMYGINPDEILGQDTTVISAKAGFEDGLSARIRDARQRGEAIDTDGSFTRGDGSSGRLSLRYAPVRNDEQDITHWISYGNDITEQFDAAKIQRRNSLILGQLSESIFLADMNGQTIDCNAASEKALGRSREDILGHRLSEFSPTPKLQNAKIHGRSQNSGTHEEFVDEIPLIRNDGQEILLETVSKRWLGDDGQPEGWITIGRDITEKRAAEKELRILKRAIEQSPSAITIAEAQKNGAPRVIFNNEAIRSMHGHEPSDTIGKESTTFVKSHMISDELGKRLTAARERGEAIDTSGAYYRADGTQGWMNARYAPVRDEKGEITHWIAFGTDITDQYQAEQQRRVLERALEFSPTAVSILEAMPDKVLQTAYVNGAFEEMTGYVRGDILNQPFSPLSAGPSADRKSSVTQISRESSQDIDERVRADGSTYMREFRSAAVQDDHGATTHYIVLSNDITARIKDEKRLRSLQIAFEQADSAISIMTVTETGNQIAFVNNAYEKMMGYSRDEVIGTTAGFLKNRDFNEPRVMETWIQSVRQGRALSLTIETQRKNGTWFVRDVESNPVRDSEGTIISWISVSRDVTQKLKDEQRLHTLQMAFEQADSAISVMAISETGGKLAFVNKAYEDMMGYARDEVIGTSTGFIKNKDYLEPGAMKKWRSSVSEGQSASITIRTQKKNGSWFLRDVETNPVRDSDGNIISWIGVSRDVTQKLEDEQRLQNLQMAIEQTDSAVTITEVVGSEKHFAFVNNAFEAMTGYTREELIGKPVDIIEIRDFLEPGSIEKQTNTIRRGGSASYYVETQRKDGSWFVREIRINPFSDSAGAVTSWIGISRDVTQKLKDEQRLRRDALILETLTEAVTFTDPDGVFLDCNRGAETLFGYSKEELVGKPTTYILADPQTQNLEHSNRVARALEGKPTQGQDTIKRKDGEERLIELVAAPFTSSDGTFLGHVTVSRDITEKQALQEQLQHAQKMEAVGQLTGGIAHDFNNLMGVISGSLQLIEGEQEDWDFVHQMARTADKSVMRGKDLVDRMLSFSRRQTLDPVETDIAELMDGTVDLLRRSIGDRINITLEYDDGLPRCLLDQAQFESAILNMSLNARDAMEPGGHLSISARQSDLGENSANQDTQNGTYVCVTIADDGTGMDDETLAKIYEPFFTTKDVGQGSGLGLSMVYGFVKQSGGHIEVKSAPGAGTQFSLFFPAAKKQGAGSVDTLGVSSREKPSGHGRILVVEDNAEMLTISRLSLTRMGYDVVTADSATAAMTQLTDNPDVKIAFIDIMLPDGMTGTELAKLLVSVRPELRVLFTSGYSDPSILKDAMDISQVIRKPFTFQELEDALGGLVEERKRLH